MPAIRAGHYGHLTLIDEQAGRILEALEVRGELDKTMRWSVVTLLGLGWAVLTVPWLAGADEGRAGRPNVVFILADDLGWAELGCYGNTFNETPHLDRLAREGVQIGVA